jgi:solute carrier family 44 protein 1 (choline transporter-like protein)
VRKSDTDDANKEENKITTKGIVWERSCTDVLCCLIFAGCLVVMVGLSGFAFSKGDPLNIITPFDSVGNRCGAPGQGLEVYGTMYPTVNTTDFTDYPYKYFTKLLPSSGPSTAPAEAEPAPAEPAANTTTDGTADPAADTTTDETADPAADTTTDGTAEPAADTTSEPAAEPAAEETNYAVTHMFQAVCVKTCPSSLANPECKPNSDSEWECPMSMFDTVPLHTYCMPESEDVMALFSQVYSQMDENNNFGKFINDLQNCWQAIVIMAFGSLVISAAYIFLLKWITKPLLYVSMVLILLCFLLLGGWAWIQRSKYDPETEKKNYQYATAGAAISWAFAGIYACFICCCWSKIALGASIMEAASAFVSQNLRVVLLPIMSYTVVFVYFLYWIVTAIHLYSIGEPEFQPGSPIANIKWES